MWKFLQSPMAAPERGSPGSPGVRKNLHQSRVEEVSENSIVELTERILAFVFGKCPAREFDYCYSVTGVKCHAVGAPFHNL